jgi:hypothetical protein
VEVGVGVAVGVLVMVGVRVVVGARREAEEGRNTLNKLATHTPASSKGSAIRSVYQRVFKISENYLLCRSNKSAKAQRNEFYNSPLIFAIK